jgi:hypothetical protein
LETIVMMIASFVVRVVVFCVVVGCLVVGRYFLFLFVLFLSSSKVFELSLHLC